VSVRLAADREYLHVRDGGITPGTPLTLSLAGRRIWSFEAPEPAGQDSGGFSVAWPPALAERLAGRALLSLDLPDQPPGEAVAVRFDDSEELFELVDEQTRAPLTVNKWGRLAHPFDRTDARLLDHVFDEAERLIALVSEKLRIELFVTGGTLLGPVRDGAILPNDDDADLAYLSAHDNPSDVALESFDIERTLTANGYEVTRHSSAHLQIMFPGRTVRDSYYIDIFSYFVCAGWFYGPFHARQRAELVTLLPLGRLDVHGRLLPAPARPEQLLEAIYGPSWGTPNPAFRFVTPPAAARRLFWWLNHFDVDRENWEEQHRQSMYGASTVESEFARFAADSLGETGTVVDLGCGFGADTRYFATRGHAAVGVDYSRPALLHARSQECENGTVRFEHSNLNMTRHAVRLRAMLTQYPAPHHVFGRRLFNALPPLGWDVTLQFVRSVLGRDEQSRGFFEVTATDGEDALRWTDFRGVGMARLRAQVLHHGLIVESAETVRAADGEQVHRLVVRGSGSDDAAGE
jgi:hypothetical protein